MGSRVSLYSFKSRDNYIMTMEFTAVMTTILYLTVGCHLEFGRTKGLNHKMIKKTILFRSNMYYLGFKWTDVASPLVDLILSPG